MNEAKLRELRNEFEVLGLNHTSEYKMLFGNENVDMGHSISAEQVKELSERLVNYKAMLEKLRANRVMSAKSLPTFLVNYKSDRGRAEQIAPVLEDRYKAYVKDRYRLKEDIKSLRRKHILAELADPNISETQRQNLTLELRFISVMPVYERLRTEITRGLEEFTASNVDFTMETGYLDRNFFRREKSSSNLERLENFELQIKIEQEKRKRLKTRAFMNEVFQCNSEFLEFHKQRVKGAKKLANSIKLQIEVMRKRDQQEMDNDTRERLELLRAKNVDGYLDILKKVKDQRIIELLQETDAFLKDICSKVHQGLQGPTVQARPSDQGQTGVTPQGEEQETELNPGEPRPYDINQSMMRTENYNTMYYNYINQNVEVIREQPSWLEGGQLKSYQLAGLQWMVSLYNNRVNGILADEMGLGKTIQTIALLCYVMEHKQNFGPFLVVVPLGTLTNWKLEFEKWAPSIKKVIYKGTPQERKEMAAFLRNNRFNVCLTTYEYVLKDKSELNRFHWQYIIVDEGHKMKNPKSQFAMTLGQVYNSEHRLLLTGTPLQNNLSELWSLLNFLLPKVFNSCEEFEKWFKTPMKKYGNVAEKELELTEEEKLLIVNRFHQVLRPFLLRRVKREVEAELPQKVERIIKVDMSAWQKIIYNQIAQKESRVILEQEARTNGLLLNKMNNMIMQLRKICNHPYLFQDYYAESEELMRSSGKFELLDRLVPKLIKAGHRMLIFTQMTQIIELLEVFMRYRSIKFLSLMGSTKHEERGERIALFNRENSEYPVFLLSTRAGGLGLNLQTADTVILFDSDWNPQMDLQAQDRVHRIGTLREVRVLRLVTNKTIEERILSKASYKRSLDEMVIQAGMYNNKSTDVERRQKLEEIIKKQNIQVKPDDEVPNDEEINRIIARDDAEFEFYQDLDKLRYETEALIYPRFNRLVNYRLVSLEEVPDYVIRKDEKPPETEELGKKRRIKIRNMEDLNDEDSLDEEIAKIEKERKRKLKERNLERRRRMERGTEDAQEEKVVAEVEEGRCDDIFLDSESEQDS